MAEIRPSQMKDSRLTFLSLFTKDPPGHFACYQCIRLHQSKVVRGPSSPFSQVLSCLRDERSFWHISCFHCYSNYAPKFVHVYLAMQRHHYGPEHGMSLEVFSHTEVCNRPDRNIIHLLPYVARIVDDELVLRTQQWILLPWSQREELYAKTELKHIYEHIRCLLWIHGDPRLPNHIKCALRYVQDGEESWAQTIRCPHCYMDCPLDATKSRGKRGRALHYEMVQSWSGLEPTGKKWRSHF